MTSVFQGMPKSWDHIKTFDKNVHYFFLIENGCRIPVTKAYCQFTTVSGQFSYTPAKQKQPETYEYLSDCVKDTGITLLSDSLTLLGVIWEWKDAVIIPRGEREPNEAPCESSPMIQPFD